MKLRTLLLVLLIGSFSIHAQTKSDIGLIYGTHDLYRLNFEFRKPLNAKYKLRLGAIAGTSYSSPWYNASSILSASNELLVERLKTEDRTQFTLFGGIERQFKQSIFSISADLLVSYLQVTDAYYSKVTELNSDNEWIVINNGWHVNNDSRSVRKTNYLNPGIQLKLAMNLPIKERFILHLAIGQTLSSPLYMNESINNDPFNEFNSQENVFTFNSISQANLGLRYIFKGK